MRMLRCWCGTRLRRHSWRVGWTLLSVADLEGSLLNKAGSGSGKSSPPSVSTTGSVTARRKTTRCGDDSEKFVTPALVLPSIQCREECGQDGLWRNEKVVRATTSTFASPETPPPDKVEDHV